MKTTLRMRRALAVLAVFLFGFTASAQIYINEILADNKTAFDSSGNGDFPDYIELINTSTNPTVLPLTNFKLSIDPSVAGLKDHARTYVFPANSSITNGFPLVVICDGKTNQRYHSLINIAKEGKDTLYLIGSGGGTRDMVRIGLQVTDFSMGRIPDGVYPGVPNGTNLFALCRPTPGDFNVQAPLGLRGRLRFNEWSPSRDREDDWFELYNPETNAVSLTGLVVTDMSTNWTQITTNSWIEAGGFIQFHCDEDPTKGSDHVKFKLASAGMTGNPPEWLRLYATNSGAGTFNIIHQAFWTNAVTFESYGWLPDGNTNVVVTFLPGKDTPGKSNFLPIENVLINEVLAHTDPPLEDTIELYNPTSTNVNIGGWWLSDDKNVYNKFRIPNGTILPPGGYVVFYEYLGEPGGFNPNGLGTFPSFALSSSQGDDVYLFSTFPGTATLNGYRRGVDFPASQNGVSYGRYVTSTGESDFIPLQTLTFGSDVTRLDPTNRLDDFRAGTGATNSLPLLGPLVISEIVYHPPPFIMEDTNIVDNDLDEYIEIYNASTATVPLWDTTVYPYPPFGYAYTNTWHIRGDIDYNFPTNVSLSPGKSLIVASLALTNVVQSNSFRAKYNIPANVRIFGGFKGHLDNGGSTIQIERPDAPQAPQHPDAGFVPYLRVDKIRFDDELPWPPEPDGLRVDDSNPFSIGYALVRKKPEEYGGDVINWYSAVPSPGWQPIWKTLTVSGSTFTLSFDALAGSTYIVESVGNLGTGTWQTVQQFPSQSTTVVRQVTANVSPGSTRFYRVRTP